MQRNQLRKTLFAALHRGTDAAAQLLPTSLLLSLFGRAVSGLRIALCLHRVAERRRPTELMPITTASPSELDKFLHLVRCARGSEPMGLAMTFDDGYQDAWEYVRTRAPRHLDVEWLFFICPEKTLERIGFRWDVCEVHHYGSESSHRVASFLNEAPDVDAENRREDLRRIAAHPAFRLATREQCLELLALPNVQLGNHSNSHLSPVALSVEDLRRDVRRATSLFQEHFGPQRHFAFPFGTPGVFVRSEQVQAVHDVTNAVQWSTEGRPYAPEERAPGALLPRFPIDGTKPARTWMLEIALHALRYRMRRAAGASPLLEGTRGRGRVSAASPAP